MAEETKWRAAKERFDRDGFAVVPGFFGGADRSEWLAQIDRYVGQVAPTLDPNHVFYEDKSRPETLLRAERMDEFDDYFRSLKESGRCRDIAEALLGSPVAPQSVDIMGKAPRTGQSTPPHQDAYYWPIDPADALTLWVAIDKVDEENGCVRYVKGSHRQPMRPHAKGEQLGFSQKLADYDENDERDADPVCLAPGDLAVHHCMTIHRADANPTNRMRRGLRFVYYAQHVKVDQHRGKAYTDTLKAKWAREGKL